MERVSVCKNSTGIYMTALDQIGEADPDEFLTQRFYVAEGGVPWC